MDFPFEITPKNFLISPDNPLQVQVKNISEKIKDVFVTVDSLLFRILNPTATEKNKSQIYSEMKAGETLHFQIGLLEEATLNLPIEDDKETYFKSIEGDFSIIYGPDLLYTDKNFRCVHVLSDFDKFLREMPLDPEIKYFPLALKHETEAIKKRKIEHDKYKKNHSKEFAEWNAKKELERKEREAERARIIAWQKVEKMKKKRRKCILM
ncbi:Protein CBG01121 [Caenorhabditis briggsae]|uniref:Protein CBG01121 n=2 Tax=Caenorhabditis briggsae TaxID=6238 RepID=A8WPL8_CAEBR|nr:Protein CBG01121 [Caenorhabditis briggsae]CAP22425.1 Protein CBG01121 [Caenorhabditis briggsae]